MADILLIGGTVLSVLLLTNIGCMVYSCCKSREHAYKTVSINSDTEFEEERNGVRSININAQSKWTRNAVIIVCSLIIIILFIGLIGNYFTGLGAIKQEEAKTKSHGINDYVLPNATIVISVDDDIRFGGEFSVYEKNRLYRYNFQVTVGNGDDIMYEASFIGDVFKRWKGFNIYGLRNDIDGTSSGSLLEFVKSNDAKESVIFKGGQHLSQSDRQKLENFFGDILCEHFIELAMKAAALGYVGTKSSPLFSLQSLAYWVYRYANSNDKVDNSEWVDLTEEREKASAVVLASKEAGFQIENVEELREYSTNSGSGRSLLIDIWPDSSCTSCMCHNNCYGGCGSDCDCWPFICVTCGCYPYCKDHDYYCSCLGMEDYCCWAAAIWDNFASRVLLGQCSHGYDCLWYDPEHSRYTCNTDCTDDGNDDCDK